MATKAGVEEFLEHARMLIEAGRLTFVPRDANIRGMAELGVTNKEVEEILLRLTPNNYVQGPEADRDAGESDVWIFGASIEKKLAYIKWKTDSGTGGLFVKCLSFHPARYELTFPLRSVKPAKRTE